MSQYVAIASNRLNFYPGTLTETPPDYRREVVSEPMSHDEARAKLAEWASVVVDPGWQFRIEPAARPAEPAPGDGRRERT